jgi:hypothetical protein
VASGNTSIKSLKPHKKNAISIEQHGTIIKPIDHVDTCGYNRWENLWDVTNPQSNIASLPGNPRANGRKKMG